MQQSKAGHFALMIAWGLEHCKSWHFAWMAASSARRGLKIAACVTLLGCCHQVAIHAYGQPV